MKVFVVTRTYYGVVTTSSTIAGVYESKEKAERLASRLEGQDVDCEVHEQEVI